MMDPRENVGELFKADDLRRAQDQAWRLLDDVASRVGPGTSEDEARTLFQNAMKERGLKSWHPPQIRFGINTTKAFAEKGEADIVLQARDVFFLDIGPVFEGYEGDVGRTYVVGDDPEMKRLAGDAQGVFELVRQYWRESGKTGAELYEFAESRARELGWSLSLAGASGHRVSEFPHAVHYRGKLKTFDKNPTAGRWILEIHLFHPNGKMAAFYEDLLD